MAELFSIVEGWTKELGPFTLKIDGVPPSLLGMTVALQLRPVKRPGLFSDGTGDVRLAQTTDALASGQVYYKPDAEDFTAAHSPYTLRWKVTDGNSDVVFFPNDAADTIVVQLP